MPRIPEVAASEAGPLVRFCYWVTRRRFGAVPQPFSVMAHHVPLMLAGAVAETASEKAATTLPVAVREIAVYRVATQVGCSWCVDFGTMLQRNDGLDIDRLTEIDSYATSDKFTEVERLAIGYADAMTEQPMRVTDEQVAELERRLGRKGLIELTQQIALENQRARFNHALGITDQGFTSGEACRIPAP